MSTRIGELAQFIRDQQARDFGRLDDAIRMANNGYWSMGIEEAANWIVWSMQLVGAVSPGELTWDMVHSGIYGTLCEKAGVTPHWKYLDDEWMRETDKMMTEAGHNGSRIYGNPFMTNSKLMTDWEPEEL